MAREKYIKKDQQVKSNKHRAGSKKQQIESNKKRGVNFNLIAKYDHIDLIFIISRSSQLFFFYLYHSLALLSF